MLKKTLLAAAALSFLALGATSPANAYYNGNNNNHNYNQNYNQNYNYNNNNYRNGNHEHYEWQYGYRKYRNYRPYPWWLQYYGWNYGRQW
jgi:hypothetical protein